MSSSFSLAASEKKIKEASFETVVKYYSKEQGKSLNQLSRLLGKEPNYISQRFQSPIISLPLVYGLSIHLQTNLIELFQNLLPENIRPSQKEKELQLQIEALQQQLADVKKERDLLEKIVMK